MKKWVIKEKELSICFVFFLVEVLDQMNQVGEIRFYITYECQTIYTEGIKELQKQFLPILTKLFDSCKD